jgi:hypothetical protein
LLPLPPRPACTSGGDNYLNMILNKFCDQVRIPIIFPLGEAVLDCDVLVFHKTKRAETFAEGYKELFAFLRCIKSEITNYRYRSPLCRRWAWPADRRSSDKC